MPDGSYSGNFEFTGLGESPRKCKRVDHTIELPKG